MRASLAPHSSVPDAHRLVDGTNASGVLGTWWATLEMSNRSRTGDDHQAHRCGGGRITPIRGRARLGRRPRHHHRRRNCRRPRLRARSYLPGAMGPPYTMDRGAVANNLLRELSEWCAPLHQREVAFHAVLREGVAGVELLRVAVEESADLIVVGRRGRGPLRELLLGSVAHHVTHHATHPVAVVPSRADLATERAPTTASRGTA